MVDASEVAKHAADAAQGLPNWLQQLLGSAVFVLVSAAGVLGYLRKNWAGHIPGDHKQEATVVAATFDTNSIRLQGETLSRMEALLDAANRIADEAVAAQDRATAAINRVESATRSMESAIRDLCHIMDRK